MGWDGMGWGRNLLHQFPSVTKKDQGSKGRAHDCLGVGGVRKGGRCASEGVSSQAPAPWAQCTSCPALHHVPLALLCTVMTSQASLCRSFWPQSPDFDRSLTRNNARIASPSPCPALSILHHTLASPTPSANPTLIACPWPSVQACSSPACLKTSQVLFRARAATGRCSSCCMATSHARTSAGSLMCARRASHWST